MMIAASTASGVFAPQRMTSAPATCLPVAPAQHVDVVEDPVLHKDRNCRATCTPSTSAQRSAAHQMVEEVQLRASVAVASGA